MGLAMGLVSLNPNTPAPCPGLCTPAGRCELPPAEGQSSPRSATISGNPGSWQTLPWALLLFLFLRRIQRSRFLRAVRKAQRGAPPAAGAPSCSPSPTASGPCSSQRPSRHPVRGEPNPELAEAVFLSRGQNTSGARGRGLNTVSTWAASGIPGPTNALSHATRLITPLPPPASPPLSRVTHSLHSI